MTRNILLFCLTLLVSIQLSGQGHIGFKTGLNFSNILSDTKEPAAGIIQDQWGRAMNFHIGMTYTYEFLDAFRVRGELLYSRKGGKYRYQGPMHRTFSGNNQSILTKGNGTYLVDVANTYLELPVSAVFKYKKIELSAGGYFGLLLFSRGEGGLGYRGTTALGTSTDSLNFILDHNYFADEPGSFTPGSEIIQVTLDGKNFSAAKTQGAYYNSATQKEKLFNRLDAGLIAGAAWYFNSTLYLGVRVQYGLMDLTNNAGHFSLSSLNNDNTALLRNSREQNFTIQAGVGFSF